MTNVKARKRTFYFHDSSLIQYIGMTSESVSERLIVVSNRLPYELDGEKLTKCVSGLVTALDGAPLQKCSWIGGVREEDFHLYLSRLEEKREEEKEEKNFNKYEPVSIPGQIKDQHKKYSNGQLWPTLHGMLNKVDRDMCDTFWKGYEAVNRIYAAAINKLLKRRYMVWIHDYHLFLVPKLVKQFADKQKLCCAIGFFLHTPFPTVETFEQLPNFKEILEGLLGSNSIGFHTEEYCENFLACCEKHVVDCQVKKLKINFELQYKGRKILVQATPAGIKYEKWSKYSEGQLSKELPEDLKLQELKTTYKKILIGVDRIDYTKGLVQKNKAFKELQDMMRNTNSEQDVLYLQIAVPCREDDPMYKALRQEYEESVREAEEYLKKNKYKSRVKVIYGKVAPEDLPILYRAVDVALVTPLIDGLNLVALEYIACQTGDPGVLILSKNTGAARYLSDALVVDPQESTEKIAKAMYRAITMPTKERQERMKKLQTEVKEKLSAERWSRLNLEPLREITKPPKANL